MGGTGKPQYPRAAARRYPGSEKENGVEPRKIRLRCASFGAIGGFFDLR